MNGTGMQTGTRARCKPAAWRPPVVGGELLSRKAARRFAAACRGVERLVRCEVNASPALVLTAAFEGLDVAALLRGLREEVALGCPAAK